jgi:hypothetical protein
VRIVVLAVLAACAPLYERGAFPADAGVVHELGCLDIAMRGAWPAQSVGPVVDARFGNRCEHAVAVDLGALRVRAGGELLELYDPHREVVPRWLPARGVGEELLEYRPRERSEIAAVDVELPGGARVHLDVPPGDALGGDEVVR